MTLPEMLGLLGAFLGTILGIALGLIFGLAWWTIGTAAAEFLLGWGAGVGIAVPFVDHLLQKSWKQERKRFEAEPSASADADKPRR